MCRLFRQYRRDVEAGSFNDDKTTRDLWIRNALFCKSFVHLHKRGYLSPGLPESCSIMPPCIPGARRTFVSADGDYYPCERILANSHNKIGDISTGVDYDKIYETAASWTRATADMCRSCWCLGTCGVGCLASVQQGGVFTAEAKQEACESYKKEAHADIVDYCRMLEANPHAFDFASNMTIS